MANLARFDPFSLTRMSPFESMMRDFMPTMMEPLLQTTGVPVITMDMQELDNAYLISAELPGVKKDDIDISISGNHVTITAETKEEKVTGGAKEWCKERCYGKYSRTLQLPVEIEEKDADAKYADGVLRLTLPKKASSMGKKLAVH